MDNVRYVCVKNKNSSKLLGRDYEMMTHRDEKSLARGADRDITRASVVPLNKQMDGVKKTCREIDQGADISRFFVFKY